MPNTTSSAINRWYYLIAILSGALLTLAFAPIEWRIIAILAPAQLFFLLQRATTHKQHLKLSYLFAVGMFGTGISWLFYSMYFFAHAGFLLAAGLTLLFVLLISLTFLLFGTLSYRLHLAPVTLKLILLLPAIWVLIEWFRNWFLTGFPWLYLGYAHIDNGLVNIAPITGSLGVSFISAILSGGLVLLIIGSQRQRTIAISAMSLIIGSSYLLGKIEWTTPLDQPIRVSLLQGNIPQAEKWLPESLQPTIDLYKEMTAESWDSDLIIWPETAIPGYFREHMDDLIKPLQDQLEETQTNLLIGGFYYNDTTGIPGSENSILAITPDYRSIYSKHHRVPFSEYIPFLKYLRWLDKWIMLPYDSVKKGTSATTLEVAGIIARMSVCYEDAYGDETIEGLPEAHMLINVSNDGWFTGSIEPYQHMEIARMRSVETGRFMLRGTNIGVSGIIDQKGKIVATAPAYTTTIIDGYAQPYTGSTPYIWVSNWLIVGITSLLVLFGFHRVRENR